MKKPDRALDVTIDRPIEGERCEAASGDLILTPNGTWHDHGNGGATPVVWADILDFPLLDLLRRRLNSLHSPSCKFLTRKFITELFEPAFHGISYGCLEHPNYDRAQFDHRRILIFFIGTE